MLLRRFYDEPLAQASYLVGCQATGEALVVDPHRMVDDYIAAAREEGLRITHVTETHIHADFVSGARDLAHRTGARLYLSGQGGPDWTYRFARASDAVLLGDGDAFPVGNIRVDVLHTPGHTPEHLSFLITDGAATSRPMGMLSGDFIFVGDVGRPDLLERAAHVHGTMDGMARTLYRSLQRTRALPDYLQLWPGHGAGSACGKALGAVPSTTLGYERMVNWAFTVADEETFVREVLAGQPDPPRYFARMKALNRDGPPPLPADTVDTITPWSLADVEARLRDGGGVIDVRPSRAFAAGHIPGTINVPVSRSFATWVGSIVPPDGDLALIVPRDRARLAAAIRSLRMIGFDHIAGLADESVLHEWARRGQPLAVSAEIDPAALAAMPTARVLDVRNDTEWALGHVADAMHVPLGTLPERMADLPTDQPIVVVCAGGTRSAIALSLLRARGIENVLNLRGGFDAWQVAGLPIAT